MKKQKKFRLASINIIYRQAGKFFALFIVCFLWQKSKKPENFLLFQQRKHTIFSFLSFFAVFCSFCSWRQPSKILGGPGLGGRGRPRAGLRPALGRPRVASLALALRSRSLRSRSLAHRASRKIQVCKMTKIAKNTGVQRLKLLKYRCAK